MQRGFVLVLGIALGACFGAPPGVDDAAPSTGADSGSSSSSSTPDDSSSSSTDAQTAGSVGGGSESSGVVESCELQESGPIVVEADGQVIEFLHIVADNGPGIATQGHADVIVRNVWIEHSGGPGIAIVDGARVTIENAVIEHTAAPASGANPSTGLNNIECDGSIETTIRNVRLLRGSSGIYLFECPDATLSFVEGHDFRGPDPRGQLVQFARSDRGVLEDFSVVNPPESWPTDNVNVSHSADIEIRRGLIDGNNAPAGVGVSFSGETANGIVEDVDAIRMGNGCFSNFAGSDGILFRRTRCRENICTDQGRGLPLSEGLMWAGGPEHMEVRIEDSQYFAPCDPANVAWPPTAFVVFELQEADFTIREPLALEFCWQ